MTPEERKIYEQGYRDGYAAASRAKHWTDNEVDTLARWTGSDADLARELGRTRLAIRMKRHKLRKEGLIGDG